MLCLVPKKIKGKIRGKKYREKKHKEIKVKRNKK